MIDLTPIFGGIIVILFGLVSAFLIPYLRRKYTAETYEQVSQAVWIAVEAAEMIFEGPGRGAEKKAYVKEQLEKMGYTINIDYLENLIESCVLELKAQGMELSAE